MTQLEDILKAAFKPVPNVKVLFNIGALFDIITGHYLNGTHGQWVLNGGLAPMTGIVGIGNNFKSTVMHFMFLTAISRAVSKIAKPRGVTYDTEMNMHEWHFTTMMERIHELEGENLLESERWVITDKTVHSGTEWHKIYKEFLDVKSKNAAKIMVKTPFWNRFRSAAMEIMMPSLTEIDSFSEYETDDVEEMQNKAELGESTGNTIHMRQGLAKLRMLMQMPRLNVGNYDYILMTAHLGKESTMQNAGPGGQVPIVKLKHLKNGDKIKGTTDKFTFLMHNCWHCYDARPLMSDSGDGPLYPRNSGDDMRLDTDLNLVKLRNLRSKSGPSGMEIQVLVSQQEGVLPSLTEFHHIKEMGKYGLEGSNVSYALALYPEVKLQRTTVRSKIDSDAKLRRALNITSEMCQMSYLWHDLEAGLQCTPKELYEELKARGYDWDELLQTRGWWSLDEDERTDLAPFLSTMDLLKMRKGEYHPWWMTPKNEQQKAAQKFVLDKLERDKKEIQARETGRKEIA